MESRPRKFMYVYNIGKIMMLFTNILLDVGKIIVTDFVFHKLVFHKLVFRDVIAYARYLFLGWDMPIFKCISGKICCCTLGLKRGGAIVRIYSVPRWDQLRSISLPYLV